MERNIVLVGPMGSGKTTVGRVLAARLGWNLVDTDDLVVAMAGRSIPEIFASGGEAEFRRLERLAVAQAAQMERTVIATGGGAPVARENRWALRERGWVVWLRAPAEVLYSRLVAGGGVADRPLLMVEDPVARLQQLIAERERPYREVAHFALDTQGLDPGAVADRIIAEYQRWGRHMRTVLVQLEDRSYNIYIGSGLLRRLGELVLQSAPRVGRALVVTDPGVGALYLETALAALKAAGIVAEAATVPPGEAAKTLAQVERLYRACVAARLDRTSAIVALGGGSLAELAGFVAATYMRGIDLVQVPTTLLGQIDASVGGKAGIDLPEGKNLVGAFHQPRAVVADLDTLATQPSRGYVAALAEAVKHGVVRDPDLIAMMERDRSAILDREPEVLALLVEVNCRIKAAVVERDEREEGLRTVLNLGHTLGHALEAYFGGDALAHGEAVAIGMAAAARLAHARGVLRDGGLPVRLEQLLCSLGLPTRFPAPVDVDRLVALVERDKKAQGGQVRWVLPVELGQAIVAPVPAAAVRAVLAALQPETGGDSLGASGGTAGGHGSPGAPTGVGRRAEEATT